MSFGQWLNSMRDGFHRNRPGILTGIGISSMITGTILAVKATPAALEDIRQKKEEEGHEELTLAQTVQCCWKRYIWATMAEIVGTGCLIGAAADNQKRLSSLMAAYNVAENGLREARAYREFVREKIGEKKEREIYQQTMQAEVDRNPPPKELHPEMIDGDAPKPACYDVEFERYYYVSYDDVAKAVNKLNYEINNGLNGYVSLNDFYEEIRVPRMKYGDNLGWSTETGLIEIPEKGNLQYAGTPNGWPCWILEFVNPPQYEYKFFRKH